MCLGDVIFTFGTRLAWHVWHSLRIFGDDTSEPDSTFEFKSAEPIPEESFTTTFPGCDDVLLKNTPLDPVQDTEQCIMVNFINSTGA